MQYVINQDVADYLNNKFGEDYAVVEPWMKRPKTDTKYKCSCEAMDDLITQCYNEENGNQRKNLVGYLRPVVSNDDEAMRNVITFVYEKVQ